MATGEPNCHYLARGVPSSNDARNGCIVLPQESPLTTMDAYIARGGISHVLAQARASLKNPSRPFTPQSSTRPLFHGDNYRAGSRPSSSYTVAECKQLNQQLEMTSIVPLPTRLPSRPTRLKTQSSTTLQSNEKLALTSSNSFKLMHAPIVSDDESDEQSSAEDKVNTDFQLTMETPFDLDTSLSLPSNDELLQSYDEIELFIDVLVGRTAFPDFGAQVGQLRQLIDTFVALSSFLQVDSTQQPNGDSGNTTAAQLRAQLFNKLSSVLLASWTANASCVLELTPSLLALYGALETASDEASAQVVTLGKTLFVLSKESDNDSCFCNVRYVESILHAIADTSKRASGHLDEKHSKYNDDDIILSIESLNIPMKALIYAAGTLKNISNAEDKMVRLLATNRAIAILSETMLWRANETTKSKEIAQFLIQTTGILRNLSVWKSNHKQFLEARIPLRLCGMIPVFMTHPELMVNISRILSKLTLHERPRAQINQNSANVRNLLALIDSRQNSWLSLVDQQHADMRFQDLLLIRVLFVLGNLCAGNDQNRRTIATACCAIAPLMAILQLYSTRYSNAQLDCEPQDINDRHRASEREQSMQVLIKLIRVLANLAINANVGAQLNGEEGLEPLLTILKGAQSVGDEELMLNSVSCITNVSYYSSAATGQAETTLSTYSFIASNRIAITQLLAQILLDRNEEAVVEAARAFGNLSRFKDVLIHMGELKVLDGLVVLLDHSNREVVYTVCGVLMNAALDHNTREALLSVRPIVGNDKVDVRSLLVGIIECAATHDLEMTLIASKALYNLLLCKDVLVASANDDDTFAFVVNLRRTIEESLRTINSQDVVVKEKSKDAEDSCEEEEVLGAYDTRQELCLVLPQLLRSIRR